MLLVVVPLWLLLGLGMYGLVVVRRTLPPRLWSSARWRADEPDVIEDPKDSGAWVVSIRNASRAPVELLDVYYDIETHADAAIPPIRLHAVPAVRVIAALRDAGYAVDYDYSLLNITPGGWYPPGVQERVSALPMPLARALRTYTATYTWRSDAGVTAPPKTVHFVQPYDHPLRPPLPDPRPATPRRA